MFAGLIGKLALGAVWGRVKTNAAHDWQAIPPKARLWILGIVVALILGVVHQIYAHHMITEAKAAAYKAGYAQAIKDVNEQAAKAVKPIQQAKTTIDAKNDAFHEGVKRNHDTQEAHISGNLDALLLGLRNDQAAGRAHADPGGGVPQADGSAGALRAPSPTDDGLAQGAATGAGDDQLIAVPAKQLYTRAAQCDRDYAALTAWEDTYQNYIDNYNEWLAKTKKVTAKH